LNEVPQFAQWAEINQTDKFTCIEPLSGFRRIMREDEGYRIYLEPGASEREIGEAVLEVLARSRVVSPIDERAFFEADRIMRNYRAWHEDFMKRYRYKTKREAYKNRRYCEVERRDGKISIKPHKRDFKPGLWWNLPPEKTVVIPETNDAGIVGAAAALALSHCEFAGLTSPPK
jgi:hypothetical protein